MILSISMPTRHILVLQPFHFETAIDEGGEDMNRFASGLLGGIAVGIVIGAGYMTDEKQRRRMKRESRRALKKAGHFFEDIVG